MNIGDTFKKYYGNKVYTYQVKGFIYIKKAWGWVWTEDIECISCQNC